MCRFCFCSFSVVVSDYILDYVCVCCFFVYQLCVIVVVPVLPFPFLLIVSVEIINQSLCVLLLCLDMYRGHCRSAIPNYYLDVVNPILCNADPLGLMEFLKDNHRLKHSMRCQLCQMDMSFTRRSSVADRYIL